MAVTFDSYLIRPLLAGGAGYAQAAVTVDGDTLERVVVKVGTSEAGSWDDPLLATVDLRFGELAGDGSILEGAFVNGPSSNSVVATFFAKLSTGGWIKGPVVNGIDLTAKYESEFPWFKPIIIDLLQRTEQERPPILKDGRRFSIKGAFPRDVKALPRCSVQVSSVPTGVTSINNSEFSGAIINSKARKAKGFNVSVDLVAWSDQPEERDVLAEWLADALLVVEETIAYFGAHEPSFSINESEDFENPLGVPIFLVTGTINFTAWSTLSFPVPTSYGHLQLVQEVP